MIKEISVSELHNKLTQKENCQIIDVREVSEYTSARIAGSVLVPLSEFEQNIKKIDFNCSSYYLCGIGKRARRAAEFLEEKGHKNLFVIEGGIKAWLESGLPVEQE